MSMFQLASFIQIILLVILSIWMHVTYFWGDHGNTIMMLAIEKEKHLHVHLGGQEDRHEAYSTCSKAHRRRKVKIHIHMQPR